MKKISKSYQVFGIGIAGAVIVLLLALWQSGKLSVLVGDKEAPKISETLWKLALQESHDVWSGKVDLSDPHFKKECPRLYLEKDDVPSSLKSCRQSIFDCFYKNRSLKIKMKNDFFSYHVNLLTQDTFEIFFEVGNKKKFQLKSKCRKIKLPQGFYWGNERKEKRDRVWHTSGIQYQVDRFQVRYIDVFKQFPSKKGKDLFEPISDFLPDQMEEFCRQRKSQVLSSQVKAALTFHHGRKDLSRINQEPPDWNTSAHPYGPRAEESPQFLMSKGASFDREFCFKIYGKECRKFNRFEFFPEALGWSGTAELMGGLPEYVHNKEHPRKNLHPSSYYYSINSSAHQAGKRIYWSGRGFRRIDFNFSTTEPFHSEFSEFKVGFRCMRLNLLEEK